MDNKWVRGCLEDKWTRGFIAGAISGFIANSLDFIMGCMGLSSVTFVEWMGILVVCHLPPFTYSETVFCFISQVFFGGAVGAVFIYLVPLIKNKNLYLKSWFFSMLIWFATDSITMLFHVEGTLNVPTKTLIANTISTTIFALTLAKCLTIFERSTPDHAMKPLNNKRE